MTWQPPRIRLAVAVLLAAVIVGLVSAHDSGAENDKVSVRLSKQPEIHLLQRDRHDDVSKHVKELIAGLASLNKPDFGLSSTLSGEAFAPLPDRQQTGMMLLTDHGISPSDGLKQLVELGPDALPFLLDALDDQTPTGIIVKHDGGFGGMWFSNEMFFNPVNPFEKALAAVRAGKREKEERDTDSYTVKVGDVCFVVIGQIVGRGYSAIRYQPTACVVVNSPTHDAALREDVRTVWKSKDARSRLFDSLVADYATEGIFNGESLDGWGLGDRLQCSAALRLLYYFPKESTSLIAPRLDKLDVAADGDINAYMKRCVANGVRADEFVKSVAWCNEPSIRASLYALFKRGCETESLLAALPAIEDKALIRERLESQIAALPADERGPYGDGYHLLRALIERTPEAARPVFERYLKDASMQRCHTVCLALREAKPTVNWDLRLLGSLLSDRRETGYDYAVNPPKNEPRLPLRVCDEAAATISGNNANFSFTLSGGHADLDRQIEAIRASLNSVQ